MFNLPASTQVNKFVPKNSFNSFLNSNQKQLLIDYVSKITWLNTLSSRSINLPGSEVAEIHIFEIHFKLKTFPVKLLDLIDKFIPYHLILLIRYSDVFMVSAAQKHSHPTNENISILDWRFSSDWLSMNNFKFKLNLMKSLDFVYSDLCFQLSGKNPNSKMSLKELVSIEQKINELEKSIIRIKISIKNCKQYNLKVELNMLLQQNEDELDNLRKLI